jgi:hypothetical protein
MTGVQTGFDRLIGTLAGEATVYDVGPESLSPHLPADMVGGSVPYIPGTEAEAVWHAAAQGCGTERVHYCYSNDGQRVWYLAAPSSSFASSPNSWCPLASALPGQSEHWDKDTVYLYEQEGQASALRWDPETGRMQLFLGPSRTILPRIQSMNANFVTINAETAKPLPWNNRTLKMERISRYTSLIILMTGVLLSLTLVLYILFLNIMAIGLNPALNKVKNQTRVATEELITKSYQAFATNTPKYLVRAQELHQSLYDVGGILLRYELKMDGSVEWEALVPQAIVATENPAFRSSKPTGTIGADGRVRIMGTQ